MLTATLLGAEVTGTVVVGPLKQASESSRIFQTSSDMYEFPPALLHHSEPASHITYSTCELHSRSTMVMALTSSGPVPSPLIIAEVLVNLNKNPILATYIYFELIFIRPILNSYLSVLRNCH